MEIEVKTGNCHWHKGMFITVRPSGRCPQSTTPGDQSVSELVMQWMTSIIHHSSELALKTGVID